VGSGNSGGQTDQGSARSGSVDPDFGNGADANAKTVKGCEDTDKVARQLCEAATQEADPFLRAALWDEYNEYKKILARQ